MSDSERESVHLLRALDRLADRFRALPESSLKTAAGEPGPRAEAGFALAGRLAEAAQRLEEPDRPPRTLPWAGVFSVGDQIAVAGHDLVAALYGTPDDEALARRVLDEALRDVTEIARQA